MAAKNIFKDPQPPKLMDGFLSGTFADLYISGYQELDGAKDFASAILSMDIENAYDHTDTDDNNLKAFLGFADEVINKTGARTVYMDSNIALTDGSKPAKDGARVIPNLYEAIDGLMLGEEILAKQTEELIGKIETISETRVPSTADAGLYVNHFTSADDGSKQYTAFLATSVYDNYVISPGIGNNGYNTSANATKATTANLHFAANEITFTVANHNNKITDVYQLSGKPEATNFDLKNDQRTIQGDALMNNSDTTYYWLPLEDYSVTDNGNDTFTIKQYSHGKIFAKGGENAGQLMDSVVVCYSHAVANHDIAVTKVENGLEVSGTMTYNLGAIIEAIQELNRRTMFMDIDMSFNGAMSYGDYVSANIPSAAYGKILDGLPAGSNGDSVHHLEAIPSA